jgi:Mce-associated membrane protein
LPPVGAKGTLVRTDPREYPLTDVDSRPSPAPRAETPEPGWWRKLLRPGRFTVLVVILLLAAAAGYLGFRAVSLSRQADAAATERTTVLSAAGRYAVDVTSYDYRDLDGSFARVYGESTASFAGQYRTASEAHAAQLTQDQSVSTGTVVAGGIQDLTHERSADVLVLVNQAITNTSNKTPEVQRSELRLALVYSGGRWLIGNVTVL